MHCNELTFPSEYEHTAFSIPPWTKVQNLDAATEPVKSQLYLKLPFDLYKNTLRRNTMIQARMVINNNLTPQNINCVSVLF